MTIHAIEQAKNVLSELEKAHYKAYIVGGAVRNLLLDLPIHDIDITTSATPAEIMALFPITFPVGIEHGTVLVRYDHVDYEITTFRSESNYKDFRHPERVTFESSLEKDLARRDFTVNAIAMDRTFHLIDPYNGQKDISMRVLKTVGIASERFKEDPLRILRAARFVSQLNFKPDIELEKAMQSKRFYVRKLSIERIYQEMSKLLAGNWVANGLQLLITTGVFSELPLFDQVSPSQFTGILKIDYRECLSDSERWATFLLSLNLTDLKFFFKEWRFSKKQEKRVSLLIGHFQVFTKKEWNEYSVYNIGIDQVRAVERLKRAFHMVSQEKCAEAYFKKLPIHSRKELKVNGNDLQRWMDLKPGAWIQELLNKIEHAVIEGELLNEGTAIQRWVETCHRQKKKY